MDLISTGNGETIWNPREGFDCEARMRLGSYRRTIDARRIVSQWNFAVERSEEEHRLGDVRAEQTSITHRGDQRIAMEF
jgi:hypothetical protein